MSLRSSWLRSARIWPRCLAALALLSTGCEKECSDGSDPDATCLCEDGAMAMGCTPDTGGGSERNVVASGGATGSPDWLRDDTEGMRGNETAVHPPMLRAGDHASMTFDCAGRAHTQLSFWLNQRVGGSDSSSNGIPIEELGLDLFVDGVFRESFGGIHSLGTNTWTSFVINVPARAHEYTFTARSDRDVAPPFVIDSIVCVNESAVPGHNGRVSFDEGFVPPGTSGDWLVDNTRGVQAGEAAIHPPALEAGGEASMVFNCDNQPHTQIGFWLNQKIGGSDSSSNGIPIEELGLDLFVDGVFRESFGGIHSLATNNWASFVINVPADTHEYTFTIRSDHAVAPAFVIDSFVCLNNVPTAGPDGRVSFDEGFLPPETRGDWLVDNTRGVQAGEAAIHPPALEANGEASMIFNCDNQPHTKLSFWLKQRIGGFDSSSNGIPNEQLGLDLFVDRELNRSFGGTLGLATNTWMKFEVDVPQLAHEYTFTIRSESAVAPAFVLDTFVCE